jgi:Protein of unknown function (DUF3761)
MTRRSFAVALAAAAAALPLGAASANAGTLQARPHGTAKIECRSGYYKNASGHCVKSPTGDPAGATAKCGDGTYSYSLHASGTCSHHGGVARWIHHP